jgi:predicted GIY-YIG superfamily endonuclease
MSDLKPSIKSIKQVSTLYTSIRPKINQRKNKHTNKQACKHFQVKLERDIGFVVTGSESRRQKGEKEYCCVHIFA